MAWSKKVESIISKGISLHNSGVSNWALTKDQALAALDQFEAKKISVLGGDVYELNDGEPEPNYDNWYCDREQNEPIDKFITRSANEARAYIVSYSSPNKKQELFVFVAE